MRHLASSSDLLLVRPPHTLRRPGDAVATDRSSIDGGAGEEGNGAPTAMLLDVPLHSSGRHTEGERQAENSPRHGWGGSGAGEALRGMARKSRKVAWRGLASLVLRVEWTQGKSFFSRSSRLGKGKSFAAAAAALGLA